MQVSYPARHEREDETVVPVPECGIIFPERIDPGKKREQRHDSNHDERDKADACWFSHGAVRLTRGIPVRDYLIGEHRVRGERCYEPREDEAGGDCQPDGIHTGRWVLRGNEGGGGAGTGVDGEGFSFGNFLNEGLCGFTIPARGSSFSFPERAAVSLSREVGYPPGMRAVFGGGSRTPDEERNMADDRALFREK